MTEDISDIGNAFIRLGLAIKEDKETGLDDETLARLLEFAPILIAAKPPLGPPPWSEEKDPISALILKWIRNGQTIPTGADSKDIRNTLTRLRRNGVIVNRGTRPNPKWCLTTDEERAQITEELRVRRKANFDVIDRIKRKHSKTNA